MKEGLDKGHDKRQDVITVTGLSRDHFSDRDCRTVSQDFLGQWNGWRACRRSQSKCADFSHDSRLSRDDMGSASKIAGGPAAVSEGVTLVRARIRFNL